MNLLEHIKGERREQRKKRLFERNVYTKISSLVRTYGLDARFLEKLNHANNYLKGKTVDFSRVKTKVPVEFSLFSLSTQDEYDLVSAIINKVNNPYLAFAHSPKEILLCASLYQMNSYLRPEELMSYDFETLLLYETAKQRVARLMERLADIRNKTGPDGKPEKDGTNRSQIYPLQKELERLQHFIAKVEDIGKTSNKSA